MTVHDPRDKVRVVYVERPQQETQQVLPQQMVVQPQQIQHIPTIPKGGSWGGSWVVPVAVSVVTIVIALAIGTGYIGLSADTTPKTTVVATKSAPKPTGNAVVGGSAAPTTIPATSVPEPTAAPAAAEEVIIPATYSANADEPEPSVADTTTITVQNTTHGPVVTGKGACAVAKGARRCA